MNEELFPKWREAEKWWTHFNKELYLEIKKLRK